MDYQLLEFFHSREHRTFRTQGRTLGLREGSSSTTYCYLRPGEFLLLQSWISPCQYYGRGAENRTQVSGTKARCPTIERLPFTTVLLLHTTSSPPAVCRLGHPTTAVDTPASAVADPHDVVSEQVHLKSFGSRARNRTESCWSCRPAPSHLATRLWLDRRDLNSQPLGPHPSALTN